MAIRAFGVGVVAVALAAATLMPGAGSAASGTAPVKLAIVPLPKSALGAAARALPIARDSGVVSNADAASNSIAKVTPAQLTRLGRITGYLLDYGTPFSARPGIREIQTEIDRYRTAADARNGLAFWRRDEVKGPSLLKKFGLDLSLKKQQLPGVSGASWSYGGTLAVKGLEPMHGVDAAFQRGQYVLDVSVSAGSAASAERLAPTIARTLFERARLAFAGRLHAGSVRLPRPLRPGPPPHGPKPADMVLTKSDFGGSATIQRQGYGKPKDSLDQNALSAFDQTMAPAGSFLDVSQEVVVGGSRLEVRYFAAVLPGEAAYGLGSKSQPDPVALGGVGDNARAGIVKVAVGGRTGYAAVVVLSRGSYLDFVVATRLSAITKTEVRKLAQSGAKRVDAGFGSPA
jgi:hypothetical protein